MSAPELRPAALAIAPTLAAILAVSAGVMLLASGATPSEPTRFALLLAFAPDLLIEISHFVSSILGLVLLLLAFGLRSRLDGAWWAAVIILAAAALLALFKGLNWEETVTLVALAEGVGSCQFGSVDRDKVKAMFKVPDDYEITLALALGYQDETHAVEPYTDSPKYWRDDKGVHHVPKKSLETVMHWNGF